MVIFLLLVCIAEAGTIWWIEGSNRKLYDALERSEKFIGEHWKDYIGEDEDDGK